MSTDVQLEEARGRMRRGHAVVALGVALACVAVVVAAVVGYHALHRDVAATVGGAPLYEQDVTAYVEQFRSYGGYDDDESWAAYLAGNGLTAEQVREAAIQALALNMVIDQKARELGIAATSEELEEALANARAAAGYADASDEVWQSYLNVYGYGEEQYEESLRITVLQNKLYEHELVKEEATDEELLEFINESLSGLSGKEVLYLRSSDYSACLCAQRLLQGLDGAGVREAMIALAALQSADNDELSEEMRAIKDYLDSDDTLTVEDGWTCASAWDDWMVEEGEALAPGELGSEIKYDSTGDAYLFYCADAFEAPDDDYQTLAAAQRGLPSSLYNVVADALASDKWSEQCSSYLAQLQEDADIQVAAMPAHLSYAVQ